MFKKEEAGFMVWKTTFNNDIKFYVVTFINEQQCQEMIARQDKEPLCCAKGYWKNWQELKVMKEGLMGMLNIKPSNLTNAEYGWFNDLMIDIKYTFFKGIN